MSEDRFKPPSSRVEDHPRGKGSAVRGLAVGLLVDVVTTMLFSVVVSMLWGFALAASGRSAREVQAAFANVEGDPLIATVLVGGGVLCSVLGGFVCERIARQGDYRVGAGLGLASVLVGFLFGEPTTSPAMTALLAVLTIGSALLGTRLAFRDAPAPTQR